MYAYLGTLVLSVIITIKIYRIQNHWEPNSKFVKEFLPSKHLEKTNPRRGSIIDHNGRLLAISTPIYDIFMDCYVRKEYYAKDTKKGDELENEWLAKADAMAKGLERILAQKGKDSTYYSRLIRESREAGKRNVSIVKNIDDKTLEQLMELPLFNEPSHKGGIKIEERDNRRYPYGSLARRTIGYINENNPNGYVGIEGSYHRELKGKGGSKWAKRTDNFEWISDIDSIAVQVEDGLDVRTTLDINMQEIVERALRAHVDTVMHINSACAVILDVETGAVRSMVNLQRDSVGRMQEAFNIAAGRPSEPGSIFKTVILTTLLDEGIVTLQDKLPISLSNMIYPGFDGPEYDNAAFRYKDLYHTDQIPVIGGLMMSSNYVFRRLVVDKYMSRPEELINRLHAYNLGADFNFELSEPGSGRSSMPDPHDGNWSESTLPATAIGYSVKVTPLQILAFYNAIANDGKMMMPYIVESFEKDGVVVKENKPQILSIVCSQETADSVTKALKTVTQEKGGTALRRMKGVKCPVAGKTGTAWIAFTKEETQKYKIKTMYKTVDNDKKYQASFAGFFPADDPKYSAIVVLYTDLLIDDSEYGNDKPVLVYKDIVNELWASDESWREVITASGSMPEFEENIIKTSGEAYIPDLTGSGLRDAIRMIESMGYNCEYSGVGHVTKQELIGETIKLTLE